MQDGGPVPAWPSRAVSINEQPQYRVQTPATWPTQAGALAATPARS
jgi:hypothetical protein